ncbi:glycoside hydrolase family 36 protein [Streptomyces sp. NPDC059853]|uniref:glycoside hydrolase family 36 protein n=1 Tax=Streptomyces sp. NPDC059853 TaxID=3346973 RepID=UPI00365B0BA7
MTVSSDERTAAAATEVTVTWGHSALSAEFAAGPDGVLRTVRLGPPGEVRAASPAPLATALPVVELLAAGTGSAWSGQRGIDTAVGRRLRLRSHRAEVDGPWHRLRLELADGVSGLAVTVLLESPDGIAVVRGSVTVTNEAAGPRTLYAVSSLTLGGLPSPGDLELHWAENDWLAECRWRREPLRRRVPDLNHALHRQDPRGRVAYSGRGSWPTDGHLPMGALTGRDGAAWLWQIESPAGWTWEAGERAAAGWLALWGPTDTEHQWSEHLAPGASFTTVPAALALSGAGFEGALAALTAYRRLLRRPHPDHTTLPVVFNDYMNTLNGDPTTAKLLPLIDAAARAGAEYFVIDAGWYDDDAGGWWDTVGAWQPAATRFPGERGIHEVLDRIRAHGMVPGLWLEPEVVGVRSPIAATLPDAAYFVRDGQRVRENGRFQLDLRHPAARRHLDATVDRIVGGWGVGYLKLDYNISVPPGTDTGGTTSPGAGLLGHARAYQAWLRGVLERHPGLVIENCASGGMRMDGSSLALVQLQSTSDQQDFLRYPPIAAAAPTAVPPEQGAVWAYPQPEFSEDAVAFTLAGALLGRVHLSGHLDRMDPGRFALVREAVEVYKGLRAELPGAVPFWPLGLPGWDDGWLALGLRTADGAGYLTVWHRDGDPVRTLPLPAWRGRALEPEIRYPAAAPGSAQWSAADGTLTVTLPRTPTALLLRLTPR